MYEWSSLYSRICEEIGQAFSIATGHLFLAHILLLVCHSTTGERQNYVRIECANNVG